MRRPALFLALLVVAACHVSRVPEETATGPADLPRLRRATTALKELIQLEKQHVAHFNEELRATRERERAIAFEVEDAERDYQRLLGDLGGIEADLADVDAELAEARQGLEAQREALSATHEQVAAAEAELQVLGATARHHESTRQELQQRLERAQDAEADEARVVAAAESSLADTRAELAATLAALQRSRAAQSLLGRELLVSLLISSLRGEGPGALAASGLVPELPVAAVGDQPASAAAPVPQAAAPVSDEANEPAPPQAGTTPGAGAAAEVAAPEAESAAESAADEAPGESQDGAAQQPAPTASEG